MGRPTMRDVAESAQVSISTVSYVLHGRRGGSDRISPETRERVEQTIAQLGYFPNRTARSLRRQRTDRICLAVPRLGVPGYDFIAHSLIEAGDTLGYTVIITITGYTGGENAIIEQMAGGLADGLVILFEEEKPLAITEALDELGNKGVAVVAISNSIRSSVIDVVHTTEGQAAREAVSYLIDRGHRRIGLIAFDSEGYRISERFRGYVDALREHDIPFDQELVRPGAASRRAAYEAAQSLLALPDRPTAVLALADVAAISAMQAARDIGLAVPDDLAVIGTGNIVEGELSIPPLTTIGVPSRSYEDVASLLLSRLNGEAAEARVHTRPWQLIVRDST
jgi:DNA-binding LacI/PurR family transcriptional regulator